MPMRFFQCRRNIYHTDVRIKEWRESYRTFTGIHCRGRLQGTELYLSNIWGTINHQHSASFFRIIQPKSRELLHKSIPMNHKSYYFKKSEFYAKLMKTHKKYFLKNLYERHTKLKTNLCNAFYYINKTHSDSI